MGGHRRVSLTSAAGLLYTPGVSETNERRSRYWRANLRVLSILLTLWFAVSFGLGILFVEQLNRFHVGGFPLGFWFSQQGSIYVFIVLVFVYARWMDRIDRDHGVD
jgi:putative solute:sodium symporter small subunit